MGDARFEDVPLADRPLRLRAETPEDLGVISALMQDAVGKVGEISWLSNRRQLVLLLNRFRWEDQSRAERDDRPYERVQSALTISSALGVRARGLSPEERQTIYSLLSISFAPGSDADGTLSLIVAGDGEIAVEVECLDVTLADLTRPWQAKSDRPPAHEPDS